MADSSTSRTVVDVEAHNHHPSITAQAILEHLQATEVLTAEAVVSMLGETRHHLSLVDLEKALIRTHVVNEAHLAEIKGQLAGLPHLPATGIRTVVLFDETVARATGAVGVTFGEPGDLPMVAMVEDLPDSVERIRAAIGEFQIVLCTYAQFTHLFAAAYRDQQLVELGAINDIYEVFDEAVRRRASDIHLSVGRPPVLRVDGKLVELPFQPLGSTWMRSEAARIIGPNRLAIVESHFDLDLAFPYGMSRFRINFGMEKNGITMAARKIPTQIPTPEEINLPRPAQAFAHLDRGLVLVTGPTGSGKSTTLAALLAGIAQHSSKHLITLEDPIEFHLPAGSSMVHQRELGHSFSSFPDGLRQALRQDPDVILVGEMRDLDTIRTAVTAAETGHLVFGTLHTFDAASTVSRIVSMYPPEEQDQIRSLLAYILKGIVSQALLPLASGRGRVAAFEVLVSTPAIANNLRKIDGHIQLRQTIETSSKDGMQSMDQALADLVRRRMVDEAVAIEKVTDLEAFKRRLAGA